MVMYDQKGSGSCPERVLTRGGFNTVYLDGLDAEAE